MASATLTLVLLLSAALGGCASLDGDLHRLTKAGDVRCDCCATPASSQNLRTAAAAATNS